MYERLAADDEGVQIPFDILDSARLLYRAWYMAEPETIMSCNKPVALDTDKRNQLDGGDDTSDFAPL